MTKAIINEAVRQGLLTYESVINDDWFHLIEKIAEKGQSINVSVGMIEKIIEGRKNNSRRFNKMMSDAVTMEPCSVLTKG